MRFWATSVGVWVLAAAGVLSALRIGAAGGETAGAAALVDTVRVLKDGGEVAGSLKEALQWCADGKYTQARELVRDICDEGGRRPVEERLPALLAWRLIASIDAEKTQSLEARYESDKSGKDLKPLLKELRDPAKSEESVLVLLAFIRLRLNAAEAFDFLKQIKKQVPENVGFGQGVHLLAVADINGACAQSGSEKELLEWVHKSKLIGVSRSQPGAAVAAAVQAPVSMPQAVAPTPVVTKPPTPVVKVEGDGVGLALVIGIGNYDILGPLDNCREDAHGVYQSLASRGYAPERVVLLTDQAEEPEKKATYTNIKRRIKQVCEFAKPKDSLVIYFAGHGTTIDGEGYLVPQDGDEKDRENCISVAKLQQQMQACKAGQKMLVLDACHSGSATRGVSGVAPSLKTQGVFVLTSCAEKELSHPDAESKHGVFTRYLLEGVEGAADANRDGDITQKELFGFVQKKMTEWGLRTGKTQRPQMLSPTGDEMVISRVPRP